MSTVIKVEQLGKKYILRHQQERFPTLRDALTKGVKRVFRPFSSSSREEFWALKDVSFDIRQGDRVGIVGRNGAGKSTLLKILSRITEPTSGRVSLKGRVASLLEVGTGFHPELTGRENIYLNGAILGMKRIEISRRFDEIVAFAEVEKFLDTPVKRYSSGMYVRLAFAVAAHLDPEILIVDEVLAVGDAQFQKKCLGKMEEVGREGRTILFVSHNLSAVGSLTSRGVFLEAGRLVLAGETQEVLGAYLKSSGSSNNLWHCEKLNDNPIQILEASVSDEKGGGGEISTCDDLLISIKYEVRSNLVNSVIAAIVHAGDNSQLLSSEDTDFNNETFVLRTPGLYQACVKIPANLLNSGEYRIRLGSGIANGVTYDNIDALHFSLVKTDDFIKMGSRRKGYLLPIFKWTTEKVN